MSIADDYKRVYDWEINEGDRTAILLDANGNEIDTLYLDGIIQEYIKSVIEKAQEGKE